MCTGTHTGKTRLRTQKRKKPDLASVTASLMRNNCSEKIDSAVIDAVSSEACLVSYRHGKADGWSAETGSLCSGPTLTVVHSLDVGCAQAANVTMSGDAHFFAFLRCSPSIITIAGFVSAGLQREATAGPIPFRGIVRTGTSVLLSTRSLVGV